jgi:hypothetical protein
MSITNLQTALYTELRDDSALMAACTGGIHWVAAPTDATYPGLVITLITGDDRRSFGDRWANVYRSRMQAFDIGDGATGTVCDIIDLVDAVLNDWAGSDIMYCRRDLYGPLGRVFENQAEEMTLAVEYEIWVEAS